MTPQEITHYSELMARFEGLELTGNKVIIGWDLTNKPFLSDTNYHKSYDWLHRVWVKFRDLDQRHWNKPEWHLHKAQIITAIIDSPIEEAFLELGKAVEWYNSQKKP